MASTAPIQEVPAPWRMKGTIYNIAFWTSSSTAADFPAKAYAPLERQSSFASAAESGKPVGGVSAIQFIRYTESPVGPYDEMVLIPGFFEVPTPEGAKTAKKKKTAVRVTCIYVSQRNTCWNGRKHWNVPKHLARFEWDELPHGGTTVRVFPHDDVAGVPDDAAESAPPAEPFFQATFKPIRFLPYFPLSTRVYGWVGANPRITQPPLPDGGATHGHGELVGTDRWCAVTPGQWSPWSCLGWADMRQGDGKTKPADGLENFWPGMPRWLLAVKLEDAKLEFGPSEYWDVPSRS